MAKGLIGKKAKMTERNSKWCLDHMEIFYAGDMPLEDRFEPEILAHMANCMGVPLIGKVTGVSWANPKYYRIDWNYQGHKFFSYHLRQDFVIIK